MHRRRLAVPLAAAIVAAAVAIPVATGSAQSAPRTLTVVNGKETTVFDDLAPRGMKRGRLSQGDRIVSSMKVTVNGSIAATLHDAATITNPRPVGFPKFTAVLQSVLQLPDGVLYANGFVDAAHGGEQLAIVGGTGAYAGARGTVAASENGAVITLQS
jgi:hypothetical protein